MRSVRTENSVIRILLRLEFVWIHFDGSVERE